MIARLLWAVILTLGMLIVAALASAGHAWAEYACFPVGFITGDAWCRVLD